jgi:hypothetical protein
VPTEVKNNVYLNEKGRKYTLPLLLSCTLLQIVVDDETLALNVISEVGPGGSFLTKGHTRKHMREIFLPEFMDRRPYNEWEIRKDDAPIWALENY